MASFSALCSNTRNYRTVAMQGSRVRRAAQRADVYQSSTPVQPANMPGALRLERPLQALPIHPRCDFCTTCWFCQGHSGHFLFRVSCSSKLHSLPCFVCQRPALTLPAHGSPVSSPHTGHQLRHVVGGNAPGTTEPHSIPASIPHHPCIHQRAQEGCPWNKNKLKRRIGAGLWDSIALLQEKQLTRGILGEEGEGEGSCVQNTAL